MPESPPTETYWSAFDTPTTIERLQALASDTVSVKLGRVGRADYAFTLTAQHPHGPGIVRGRIETVTNGTRLQVEGRYRRNRRLAAALVPASIGLTAMIATGTGFYPLLIAVPLLLIVGSGVIDRLSAPRRLAMGHLQQAIHEDAPPPSARRRRRVKKRQWGKGSSS